MDELNLNYKTTSLLTIVVTDRTGQAVTDAAGALTLLGSDGNTLLNGVGFTEEGGGSYIYEIPSDLAVSLREKLTAKVTFTKDGKQAYAEYRLIVTLDQD